MTIAILTRNAAHHFVNLYAGHVNFILKIPQRGNLGLWIRVRLIRVQTKTPQHFSQPPGSGSPDIESIFLDECKKKSNLLQLQQFYQLILGEKEVKIIQ